MDIQLVTHYKRSQCRFFAAGKCAKGIECTWAHGEEDVQEPPPELDVVEEAHNGHQGVDNPATEVLPEPTREEELSPESLAERATALAAECASLRKARAECERLIGREKATSEALRKQLDEVTAELKVEKQSKTSLQQRIDALEQSLAGVKEALDQLKRENQRLSFVPATAIVDRAQPATNFQWEFETEWGWSAMGVDTSSALMKAYFAHREGGPTTLTVSSGTNMYHFDLKAKTQRNIQSGATRKVRCTFSIPPHWSLSSDHLLEKLAGQNTPTNPNSQLLLDGFREGHEVFMILPDGLPQVNRALSNIPFGQAGSVVGPSTMGATRNGLRVRFPQGTVDLSLDALSTVRPEIRCDFREGDLVFCRAASPQYLAMKGISPGDRFNILMLDMLKSKDHARVGCAGVSRVVDVCVGVLTRDNPGSGSAMLPGGFRLNQLVYCTTTLSSVAKKGEAGTIECQCDSERRALRVRFAGGTCTVNAKKLSSDPPKLVGDFRAGQRVYHTGDAVNPIARGEEGMILGPSHEESDPSLVRAEFNHRQFDLPVSCLSRDPPALEGGFRPRRRVFFTGDCFKEFAKGEDGIVVGPGTVRGTVTVHFRVGTYNIDPRLLTLEPPSLEGGFTTGDEAFFAQDDHEHVFRGERGVVLGSSSNSAAGKIRVKFAHGIHDVDALCATPSAPPRRLFSNVCREVTEEAELEELTSLLQDSIFHHVADPSGEVSMCEAMRASMVVKKAWRIENWELWRSYEDGRRQVMDSMLAHGLTPHPIEPQLCGALRRFGTARSITGSTANEGYFFHGTEFRTAREIAVSGFDDRLSSPGFYGRGTYFAAQACKSVQYSPEEGGLRTMIVSRVTVGDPHFADKVDKEMRRPPVRAGTQRPCDSVIAKPGVMPGHHKGRQAHQEVVVFEKTQAYPEFLVRYGKP